MSETRQQEARYLQPFGCIGTQFSGCRWELDSFQRHQSLFSSGFPRTSISQRPRLVWWEWQRNPGSSWIETPKNARHTSVIPAQYLVRLPIQTYVKQSRLDSKTCKSPGWAKGWWNPVFWKQKRIWRSSLMHFRQYMVRRAQEPPTVQMELVFWYAKTLSCKDGLNTLMVSLIGHYLSVTAQHSYLRLSALADYALLLSIYSISDNCVRESTLAQWLEHWIFNLEDRVRFPRQAWKFFQLCFIPLLRLSCRKISMMKLSTDYYKWNVIRCLMSSQPSLKQWEQ